MRLVMQVPEMRVPARGGYSSLLNGLSPLLACLDPQRRFPIVNARTAKLLAALGKRPDVEGGVALSRLIGKYGLRHAFDLDIYAQTRSKQFPKSRAVPRLRLNEPKAIGLKAEESTIAILRKNRLKVRRLHNALINRFNRALEWKYVLAESTFDAVVENWKKGRRLLIEAKPTTAGPTGRMHLRQAIGQLYDYRLRHFEKTHDQVDLALLTVSKPDASALALLMHLRIEALWFEGKSLRGTIALVD